MPDLSTHLLVGAAVAILLGKEGDKKQFVLVLLGSILIDAGRPISWLLSGTEFYWLSPLEGIHSILGAVLLSAFAATCFSSSTLTLKNRFLLILSGAFSHLIMDLTMWPWGEFGLSLLYPIKIAFSFELFWPGFVWYPLVGLVILVFSITLKLSSRMLRSYWKMFRNS